MSRADREVTRRTEMAATEMRFSAAGTGSLDWFRRVFLVAAVYDLVLGGVFFLFYDPIFEALDVQPPEHASYAHLSAAFVFVQGAAYLLVARNPMRNIDLVKVGVLYKTVYSGLAIYYFARGDLLDNSFAWFAAFDIVFIVLFVAFLRRAGAARWDA
jgi:hypothetical protein